LTTDTGSSAIDRITQSGLLTVSGTEAGAVVQYSANNGRTWTNTFSPAEGANTVLVRQTDIAGNVSTSATLAFTRDTTAPLAPKVVLTSDTGSSNSDKLTKIATLAVTGTETGAKIEYSTDSGTTWTPTFTSVEGNNSVQVRQVDLAGNASPAASFEFTRDTNAPVAPVIALASDTGASNSDRITKVGTLTTTGIEPGAKVEYSVNNGSTWATTFTPAQGAVTVLARQTDAAGNISARSLPLAITFDTVAPAAPVVALANDTGTSATDRITADGSLKLSGTVAGATVEYSVDGGKSWSPTFTAVENANSVQVRQTDLAGNISLASTPLAFALRTTPAAAPIVALASDTGTSATDRITKTGTLAVTGTEAGARIEYSTNNGTTWRTTFTPVEGRNAVQVRQVTLSRVSSPTPFEFTLDTRAPATPTVALKSDTGTLGNDRVTNSAELSLGAIEPNAKVEHSTNNGATWTAGFAPAQGAVSVLVRQTDAAGNISARSAPLAFTLDNSPPVVRPMVFAAQSRSVSLVFDSAVAGVTLDDFRISGMTATGAIDLRLNDPQVATLFGTISLTGTGTTRTLTFAKITRPTSGAYTLSLVASGSNIIDVAGNQLAAGSSVTFTG
ncbi:MAG: Ig-like domain repeat protein, partial [Planctomycetia bacterium]